MFNPRWVYTFVLYFLAPYIFFHLFWRARKQPEYLHHVKERFGLYGVFPNKPVLWLHTVSVGETRAAAALVQQLREHYPAHQILLTHTTPTGRATSEQLFGDQVMRVYLPYDYPFAVRRFLRRFNPQVGVLLETEIWLNLICACQQHNVPLLLLNARLSEKSARNYARFPRFTQMALDKLTYIAAQTYDDARRLAHLGASDVRVMGNLKFDIAPTATMQSLGKQLRAQFGESRFIFLAASTREGEESLILEMLAQLDIPGLLAVIVPRHPQRFDDVARLIAQSGHSPQRRSTNQSVSDNTRYVLGDSMGELSAYYAACDLAFIGGSLLPFGGQNLIEACAEGKPVLIGPHTYNFAQASESAIAAGAALRVADKDELGRQIRHLFQSPDKIRAMGAAGREFVGKNTGATTLALQFIEAEKRGASSG